MNLEIVDGKLHHCGKMSRNIRLKQKELASTYDKNVHKSVCDKFKKSMVCKSALLDGKLVAMGGGYSDFISDTCFVWFAGSEFNMKIRFSIIKELIKNIKEILHYKNKVVSLFDLNDKVSIRMARFLGFEISQDTRENHGSYVMMEINKKQFRR